jgi:Predicted acyltransferases
MAVSAQTAVAAHRRIGRVREIEGMRAVAAGLVLVFHLSTSLNLTHPALISADVMYWIGRFGPLGVAVFFVLSGYLLYQPFVASALADEPPPNLGRYYLRRFARIFPAYWVALAVWLFVIGPDQIHGLGDVAEYFGLAQNYHAGSLLRGLGVAWTLVIEVSFYVVLPAIAFALRGRRPAPTRKARLRRQMIGLAVLYAGGLAARLWTNNSHDVFTFQHHLWRPQLYIDFWLPGFLDWFALGMLLAVLASMVRSGDVIPRWISALARHTGWSWGIAIALYWLLHQANFPTHIGQRYTLFQAMTRNTMMPLVAVFLVLPIALAAGRGGVVRSILASEVLVMVGTVSYGIYLWHLIVMYQVTHWIFMKDIPRSAAVQTVLVVSLTAVAATLSYYVVERPFVRWSAKFGRSR